MIRGPRVWIIVYSPLTNFRVYCCAFAAFWLEDHEHLPEHARRRPQEDSAGHPTPQSRSAPLPRFCGLRGAGCSQGNGGCHPLLPLGRLLYLAEPIYQELLWEFYSTFEHFQTHAGEHGNAIQFRLGGESYSLNYDDFGRALGLLPPFACHLAIEENNSPIFRDQQFFERICLPEFAGPVFTPGYTTATQLRPEWRILNQLLGKSYTPSDGSTSHLQLRTLHCLHSISQEEDNLHLSSLIARTVAKASRCGRALACGPVVTALARYFNIDLSGFTVILPPTPFSRDTLRRLLILQRDRDVTWIWGLPRPVPHATEGEDLPESSDAATRRTISRTNRRTTPSAAGASTSAAGPSAAAPTSYIAEQLAALSCQNEQILAGQEHINARLDRERKVWCRIISAQHYMMSYLDMDPAAVSYPWEASPGHEDFYPPPTGDGGDEN
ncbi:unnamed protein product [Linum trigynum]|uniref:Uncharacterized protein n=1 Tax=Linum trigynum TaxID=586398 RepID=A0AAV2CEK4_9ROSI